LEVEHIFRDFGIILGAEISASLVALAVVATLLLQATTGGYVAWRLGLIEEPRPETAG
jgi:hypothetical protein